MTPILGPFDELYEIQTRSPSPSCQKTPAKCRVIELLTYYRDNYLHKNFRQRTHDTANMSDREPKILILIIIFAVVVVITAAIVTIIFQLLVRYVMFLFISYLFPVMNFPNWIQINIRMTGKMCYILKRWFYKLPAAGFRKIEWQQKHKFLRV